MAIKVIKQGVKEFNITCPNCGCEFTYEYEDVSIGVVPCPCCQAHLPHKGVRGGNEDLGTETIPQLQRIYYCPKTGMEYNDLVYRPFTLPGWATKSDNWSGCEGCPNNPKYLKAPYIGDSPCQWCQKNPNKITCTSGGSNV
nr:MAG TPA: Transcription initiation factor IIE, alpha FINGER, Transcription [Caudoviricetes sp.]